MKSSFVIVPRLITPSISSNDKIKIDIFFSGYGKIKEHKIVMSYSSENLINEEDPGILQFRIGKSTLDNKDVGIPDFDNTRTIPLDKTGKTIRGADGIFLPVPNRQNLAEPISQIMGEVITGKEGSLDLAPIHIEINTHKKTASGDHKIDFILTYKDEEDEIATDHQQLTIHVKNKMERYGWKIAIAGAIVGLVSLIISAISNLLPD